MLFNSLDFAIFLPIVFSLYWLLNKAGLRIQNLFILLASYFFYGWWDWRFLSLILFSTTIDYFVGLSLAAQANKKKRKYLLYLSVFINLGFLGFFKYFNFFLDNFISAFSLFGLQFNASTLQIILPVGISFYTFQTLSYTIDIYRNQIKPSRDFIAFAAFVAFFPQLVAGPIERAKNLLPQFLTKRTFDESKARDGLRQILWGLFKKVVIADSCAEFADFFFKYNDAYPGSALLLGAIFFAFQIYGDFSGYSDIAIGTARLFGFNLMQNFAFPYFSRDIAEFWRRWHISLSTWFRDYLYIPLGGSRGSKWNQIRNVFLIFLVSGFWHGANWTFIAWGALNALYFLPLLLFNRNRKNLEVVAKGKFLPNWRDLMAIGMTFFLTTLAWVFFRAKNIAHAFEYLSGIFSTSLFTFPDYPGRSKSALTLLLILILCLVEWLGREHQHALENLRRYQPRFVRWLIYCAIIFMIGMFMQTTETPFIYFQF